MNHEPTAEDRAHVRAEADDHCGYCLSPQYLVLGWLEIEHIKPRSLGGSSDRTNLWLSCRVCNVFKGAQTSAIDPITRKRTALFNPRRQKWRDHFVWSDDGTRILGRTSCGRATVIALQLNHVISVTVRRQWVEVGWHPPKDLA